MKKTTIVLSILVIMMVFTNAFSFIDVPQGHWAYESLNKLYDSGVIKGKQFSGDEYASRYYFATVIARMFENIQSGKIKIENISYEDFERINRLSIEFANEMNLFGYRLAKLRKTIDVLKQQIEISKREKVDKIEVEKVNHNFSFDFRLRNEKTVFDYSNDNGSVAANDQVSNDHVFGINWNADFGNGLTYINRTEFNHEHENAGGGDFNTVGSQAIVTTYFNYEYNMYNFSIGRQYFNIANALVFSNRDNGIKYSKILDESSDLILMATKESNATNNFVNTYAVNYLKYIDEDVLNTYWINSTSARWSNASSIISGNADICSTINYLGASYKSQMNGMKYYYELVFSDYTDSIKDTITNGGSGNIGMQMAYQFGITRTLNQSTDLRFIYTHHDDFFKRLNVDPTLTLPYYDELGYGGISGAEAISDFRSAGFSSYFLRFENYLSNSATLAFNIEMIEDESTLAAGQIADDRLVFGLKFDKAIKSSVFSVEYTQVNSEMATAPKDVKINGTGQESLAKPVTAANAIFGDGFDPIDQKTLRITLTHNF
ncbi:MAG: hypothetical protein M0R46_01180 [Candidatus Muirbacterium halophilum]|nr:hypothetical protein [Candidatus Muirbacterium halophilum]MCK9474508.1 hypothetical protein [Candidatus Muirbacterium halophilum]